MIQELNQLRRLYYGDNLDVLREHIASESVDLVYLDPNLTRTPITTSCSSHRLARRQTARSKRLRIPEPLLARHARKRRYPSPIEGEGGAPSPLMGEG